MVRIESLLSARLFMSPQRVGDRLFFISNLSGHMSLYAMDVGGSVPEPLLPPDIALQNPTLMGGYPFYVFPGLGKIMVMIDRDGDENYQPMWIPLDGGYPRKALPALEGCRVHLGEVDGERNVAYFSAESRTEAETEVLLADLEEGKLTSLAKGMYVGGAAPAKPDHSQALVFEGYSVGDMVVYLWSAADGGRKLLFGKPLEARQEGEQVPLTALRSADLTPHGQGILCVTAWFEDTYSLAYMPFDKQQVIEPVEVVGVEHRGAGEMVSATHLAGDRYLVTYNIDGISWGYEGRFDEAARKMTLEHVIFGKGQLAEGVVQSCRYDKATDSYALAFSSATSPAQLYTVEGKARDQVRAHTRERLLGIPAEWLSPGEDASYQSFDGTRISARLYRPAQALGFSGPRPLVLYVHGGPQSQERPDFTWFSMPLIQYLTMHGFAVFVPNVRGSTGYGLQYTKQVDRDWGGKDRLDHVHALKLLAEDPRLDTQRAGVVGRSYGGYMTLTLAGRHPELWSAAVDMFGPYDLLTFVERIPPTWKPYFKLILGDPENPTEREFLIERSPKTYLHQLQCPLLVIQGKNDPRVVEAESRDLVEALRAQGKTVEYLMFENEGHDVLKFENRVRCYQAITDFFVRYLKP